MTEPEIAVKKQRYHMPIQLLGLDDQGRQLYTCPGRGCGETAYLDEDGHGHCPSCEPLAEAILAMMDDAMQRIPRGPLSDTR